MKTILFPLLAALALIPLPAFPENAAPGQPPAAASLQATAPTPETALASLVSEIASASDLSRKEKEKRIAEAVREAVTAAVAAAMDPSQVVATVTSLTTAAAKAAPEYAQAIVASVEDLPALAPIDGAFAQVRAAILTAAAEANESGNVAHFGSNPRRPPASPEFGGSTTDVVVSRSH